MTASSDIVAAADTVKVLLEQLNVKTHISGHRHTGHIQTDTAGAQSLTEIVLPMPIAWPNTYGRIQISMEGLDYTQETIDVAAWAQTQGLANPDLLDFPAYSVQAQRQVNQSTLDSTLKNAELTPEQRQLMEEAVSYTHLDVYKRQTADPVPGLRRTDRVNIKLKNRIKAGIIFFAWMPASNKKQGGVRVFFRSYFSSKERMCVCELLLQTMAGGCSVFCFSASAIKDSNSGVVLAEYQAMPSGTGLTSLSGIFNKPENFFDREQGKIVNPMPDWTAINILSKLV